MLVVPLFDLLAMKAPTHSLLFHTMEKFSYACTELPIQDTQQARDYFEPCDARPPPLSSKERYGTTHSRSTTCIALKFWIKQADSLRCWASKTWTTTC